MIIFEIISLIHSVQVLHQHANIPAQLSPEYFLHHFTYKISNGSQNFDLHVLYYISTGYLEVKKNFVIILMLEEWVFFLISWCNI